MEAALINRLLADAGVGAVVARRVTPVRRDQGGLLPALVLHRVGGSHDYHLGGASGLVASRVQIDCWGSTYASAKAAAAATKAALNGARWVANPVRVDAVLIEGERDDTFDEGGKALYRTSLDFMVHHAIA